MQVNPYSSDINLDKLYTENTEEEFIKKGRLRAVKLFDEMSAKVPAYVKFKNDSGFSGDASNMLAIDKDNYLRKFPRNELVWDGDFKNQAWIISATSGSTGEPYYFPRQSDQDEIYAKTAEAYLISNFDIDKKSTLYINAFPMGIWIGGVFTYEAITRVASKGYNLSIITPGINKLEVIKTVKNLGSDFDQIIIGSYAPFLKDILDDGETMGLNWQDYNLGFIFSAEAFTEEFREFVQKKTGFSNILSSTLNHYGTVDLGTMAHETPLAVLVRRLALQNDEVYKELFGEINKTPTLAQYDPSLFYFEENEGNLLCSSFSGLPLYRYDLKDKGGIRTKKEIYALFEKHGISLDDALKAQGVDKPAWNLPFVFVYERSDFSVSFFAFQIYPETLRKALINDEFNSDITGKFAMEVVYNNEGRQVFNVHIEKRPETEISTELSTKISLAIRNKLMEENSEYRKTAEESGVDVVEPKVVFWPYEDVKYFRPGGKQKWVIKN